MKRIRPLLLCVSVASTSCLGSNDPAPDPSELLASYDIQGLTAIDPITTEGFLTLTFDDGPGDYTNDIVDTLVRHNIQATFFCIGNRIPGRREIIDYAVDHGQQIASHSFNHEPQPSLDEEVFKHRVRAVKLNIGDKDNGRLYFRFPFGAAGDDQMRWLKEVDIDGRFYRPVGWHLDSQDFEFNTDYPAKEFSERIVDPDDYLCGGNPFQEDFTGWAIFTARQTKGGVMLFHDTKQITRDKLEAILSGFESPDRYWASLPPDKLARYGAFYDCKKVKRNFRFEYQTLWSGAWPSLRDL
jgi:peptidoglycan/xylan/chitin deacetylase (PgdA/CDA1 family)